MMCASADLPKPSGAGLETTAIGTTVQSHHYCADAIASKLFVIGSDHMTHGMQAIFAVLLHLLPTQQDWPCQVTML